MNSSSITDQELIKKLIESAGITSKPDLEQEYEAVQRQELAKQEDEKQFSEQIS